MAVLEAVRPAAAKRGLETPLELWGYFVEQCRERLHVVLCMSPIGEAFRWVGGKGCGQAAVGRPL
jgi:dynein heavy chain